MSSPKITPQTSDSKPRRVIPPPTKEEIARMREEGRRLGDELAERLEPLFGLRPEDYYFVHE